MSSALSTLRREFRGDIIEPGQAEYESARRSVFVTGSPAYVVRPANVPDVQAAVRFATGTGLALSVRGGGHGFQGFATNDGGLVIDLGGLAEVAVVDEQRRIVRIGGGATWGQVADALSPYGLAISSGDTTSVGVGGLTLSGGIGWKVRKYGLALDNLVRHRGGDRCRGGGPREHGGARGPVLGDPRWRRQPRHRDRLRLHRAPHDRGLPRQPQVPRLGGGERAAGLGGPPPLGARRAHLGGEPREPLRGRAGSAGGDPGRRRQRRPRSCGRGARPAPSARHGARRPGRPDALRRHPRRGRDAAAGHPLRHPERVRRPGLGAGGAPDPRRGGDLARVADHRRAQPRWCGVTGPRRRHGVRTSLGASWCS